MNKMVDFEGAIGNAWKFAKDKERLSVLFGLDIVSFVLAFLPMFLILRSVRPSAIGVLGLLQSLGWIFVGVIIAVLVMLFSLLMFTHNYANQKSLGKSANFAARNYLRFLAAMVVVWVVEAILVFVPIPIVNLALAIIAALAFFFVSPEIAVSGNGVFNSISNSYRLFRQNWLRVILTILLNAVLGLIIVLIFAIPFIVSLFLFILPAAISGGVMSVLPAVIVTGLIMLVGFTLATLLTIGIQTDVYMQLKKKKN